MLIHHMFLMLDAPQINNTTFFNVATEDIAALDGITDLVYFTQRDMSSVSFIDIIDGFTNIFNIKY